MVLCYSSLSELNHQNTYSFLNMPRFFIPSWHMALQMLFYLLQITILPLLHLVDNYLFFKTPLKCHLFYEIPLSLPVGDICHIDIFIMASTALDFVYMVVSQLRLCNIGGIQILGKNKQLPLILIFQHKDMHLNNHMEEKRRNN